MTKRHFELFASVIRADLDASRQAGPTAQKHAHGNARYAASTFAHVAMADNPRFDRDRFMVACGLQDAPAKGKR